MDRNLIDRYHTKRNKPAFKQLDLNIAYHMPCHQKALCNLRASNREEVAPGILDLVPGLSVHFINRGCCGMSGTFGLKKRYYELSMDTEKALFEVIQNQLLIRSALNAACAKCKSSKVQEKDRASNLAAR